MLLDAQNLFCENQTIVAQNEYSENVICFGKNDVSFVPVVIQVVEDFDKLTSLQVSIETDAEEGFSNPTTLATSSLDLAELLVGKTFPITFLPKGNKGYMRLAFSVNGETPSVGKITAGVVAKNGLSYHEID